MPVRRKRTRNRRISDASIEQLRESIRRGVPWVHIDFHTFGRLDLIALVTGHHFRLCSVWLDPDDSETAEFLWRALEDDIMCEHLRRRPGTRPWAWWQFSAPEPLRVIDIDEERMACDGGRIYESEREYLERLDLLTDTEREIFQKFGEIDLARVSSGMFGECKNCWAEARRRAALIDFELDAAVLPHDDFWLPADLIFDCEHREKWLREPIFAWTAKG